MKPPYRVPLMTEIAALPWNGFNVASTFSGGGGSSTGYRMAGFRVLWASEFVEAARDTYRANAAPYTVLDARDIRNVKPEEILQACGLKAGELDLLDGSPPCASFSTAGKRHKSWGTVKVYSDTEQRTDDLFYEFIRILKGVQPRTFVAENVSGLVKGSAKGYFIKIIGELKAAGYRVECKLLDAQWLGVPQARQRVIFVGVREDLACAPAFPDPLDTRYSIKDALPHITAISARNGPNYTRKASDLALPARTITGDNAQTRWEVNGPPMMPAFPEPLDYRYSVKDALPWVQKVVHDTSGTWGTGDVTNRPCPTVTVGVNSVNSNHFKVEAETDISRFAIGDEWDHTPVGGASEKYFSLIRPNPKMPVPTITAIGVLSAAGVVHPFEKRRFSIGELRRLCGFPDDYVLTGSYAQQWERLGRSVPPVMMAAIASTVRDYILRRLS